MVQAMPPTSYPPVMAPAPGLPGGAASFLETHVLSGSALRNRGVAASDTAAAGSPAQSLKLGNGVAYAGESRATQLSVLSLLVLELSLNLPHS